MLDKFTKNQIEESWANAIEEGLKRNPKYQEFIEYKQKELKFWKILCLVLIGIIIFMVWNSATKEERKMIKQRQEILDRIERGPILFPSSGLGEE